nr:uncharacterized protein LOC113819537 [Penaeus vannamei]
MAIRVQKGPIKVTLQSVFVPHEDYTTRPMDQPWFGPHCKAAADNKARAWVSYKRSPTSRNKQLHTAACSRMTRAQKWAVARWKDLWTKLIGQLLPQTRSRFFNVSISVQEVRKELKSLDVTKAVGPDRISPHTLVNCADQLATPLAALFQACMAQKIWPKIWKTANVVAIHKKMSKTSPTNYRPISLLSIVAKV